MRNEPIGLVGRQEIKGWQEELNRIRSAQAGAMAHYPRWWVEPESVWVRIGRVLSAFAFWCVTSVVLGFLLQSLWAGMFVAAAGTFGGFLWRSR